MAYTVTNFKTKKALKEAVQKYHDCKLPNGEYRKTLTIRAYQPGLGPCLDNFTGTVYLEGPHYPEAHKWYAQAEMKDGIIIKVK